MTIADSRLMHLISDEEFETMSEVQDSPSAQICLASAGVFCGSLPSLTTALGHLGASGVADLAAIALAAASGAVTVVTAYTWRRQYLRRTGLRERVRARPRHEVDMIPDITLGDALSGD